MEGARQHTLECMMMFSAASAREKTSVAYTPSDDASGPSRAPHPFSTTRNSRDDMRAPPRATRADGPLPQGCAAVVTAVSVAAVVRARRAREEERGLHDERDAGER